MGLQVHRYFISAVLHLTPLVLLKYVAMDHSYESLIPSYMLLKLYGLITFLYQFNSH